MGRKAHPGDDPILADIRSAVDEGYFDRRKTEGQSELESLSVEELKERVAMMSPMRRKAYLAEIGNFRD